MKPKCKLCGSLHWTYEEHAITSGSEEARKVGASVLGYEKRIAVFPDPNPPETTTTTTDGPMVIKRTEPITGRNKRTRGRPRKWASEAERKKAYRSRG